MGFARRSTASTYTPQDGDTLKKIAEREATEEFVLTAADIARFNWGTADPDTIDEFMRDVLGCYKRAQNKAFMISADVEVKTDLLIPKPFKKAGLATDTTHTIRVKKVKPPPKQFEACCKIEGVTFEFDRSFVRPSVVDDLSKVEDELAKHPDSKIMIFGHTDKVGTEAYNKSLSERRAKSVHAFITNKPDIWEELYNSENWGIKAVQEILKDLGNPYDPGTVDGINGPKTKAAVKQFQTDNGLTPDTVAGPNTRKKLFEVYMTGNHDVEIDDGRFMDPKHMGCGEFNPIKDTEDPHEPNRRVTFYLFNEARLPVLPCKNGDIAPCKKQTSVPLPRHNDPFHCSFYDSIAKNCPCEGGGTLPVPKVAVKIKEEDGTTDPIVGILVEKSRKYKAVPDPDEPGTFAWLSTSKKITLEDADKQIVNVKAGKDPSGAVAAERLKVTFTPASGKPAVTATVKLTVEILEIVSNVEPKDMKGKIVPEKPERKTRSKFVPAPLIIGQHYDIEVRGHIEPSKGTAFAWTASGVVTDGSTTAEILKLKATALSAAENDKELTVKITTAEGEFEHKHKLTAVKVEILPITTNVTIKSTDDINKIINPAGMVILSGAAKSDVKQVPKIEITKMEPDLGWTNDDDRIAWWIRGDDKPAGYEGTADFLNQDTAKRGKKIQVFGTKKEDVLIQPYSGGFGYGMYRAHVIPVHGVKYRVNRIFTTGVGARAPSSSHADAKKHVKTMNIYLRQAGIEMIPDDSVEVAKSTGNNKIGRASLDSKLVTVTRDSAGHFDVQVKTADVNLTFGASSNDSKAAIRINERNEVISFAYMHSEAGAGALATARLCPVNHAPKARKDPPRPYTKATYTMEDKGVPASSLIPKTGMPADTPVGTVKMVVLFPDVGWKTTQVNRHIDLLWGVSVPNSSIDGSSSATGGEATVQAYGNTLAHEVGHILGLGHRGGGGVPDGLMIPPAENLMHPNNPPPQAMDLDIIQVKGIRFSEVMFRNP